MIRTLKIGDNIYQNLGLTLSKPSEKTIEEKVLTVDTDGKEHYTTRPVTIVEYVEEDNPLIPQDIEALRAATIDTLSWLIGDTVRRATGDAMKLNAANSKAITLLAKLVAPIVDTTTLTENEKAALDKLTALADNGYADSALLNASLDAVIGNIATYSTLIDQAVVAKTRDELIGILEGVK